MNVKSKQLICILVVLSTFLCGCQQAPKESVITSKNDGAFDIKAAQSAAETHDAAETQGISYTDTFTNNDGSVEFQLSIDETVTAADMPVVEVIPHYLTEEDAQRVAYALFKNAAFYDARPTLSAEYSRSEILEKVDRWSQYANDDAILKLLGKESKDTVELIKRFIENYTIMSATAPDGAAVGPCQWKFKKSSYYTVSAEEAEKRDTSKDNDQISAEVRIGTVSYKYNAATRNLSDYKLNNISVYLYSGISPNSIDTAIFRSWLCRTEEPTQEQISNIQQKADQMLREMDLGQWQIDQCNVKTQYFGDTPEYIINVTAVPLLNGIPAIRQPQLANLKSEETYASNYYLTDANFTFSANGELISFELDSPIEIKSTINKNVAVMGFDALIDRLKNLLMLRDSGEYGLSAISDAVGENVKCTARIESMEYGLSRIKVPDTDECYYYVPSVVFNGTAQYYGEASGNTYFETDTPQPLVALNAVDGTVITLWQN